MGFLIVNKKNFVLCSLMLFLSYTGLKAEFLAMYIISRILLLWFDSQKFSIPNQIYCMAARTPCSSVHYILQNMGEKLTKCESHREQTIVKKYEIVVQSYRSYKVISFGLNIIFNHMHWHCVPFKLCIYIFM